MALAFTINPAAGIAQTPASDTLDIYWIDVEGGAATLIVTPSNQSVLMDSGWARTDDRDAKRIQRAMTDADIDRIDYFITSHFHRDHVGGLSALASVIDIGQFIDHGDSVEQENEAGKALWSEYLKIADGNRRTIKPSDKLRLNGLEFTFVSAHGENIPRALAPIGPNPFCAGTSAGPPDRGENGRSVGYLLSLGGFQFLNLGDLTIDRQHDLACPENKLGTVDLLQVPHHGNDLAKQLMWALGSRVAIGNQGPHKGGSAEGFEIMAAVPGIEDIWQVHRALDTGDTDNTDEALVANHTDEDDCLGHWIKAMVHPDGRSYSVLNGRNGNSRTYFSQ